VNAPNHALPLIEVNKTWIESELTFKCECGYQGHVSELLCLKEGQGLWCPKCRSDKIEWIMETQTKKRPVQLRLVEEKKE